ncbi:hypothetical protein H696_05199 [Fonticula alba]|uniref:Uncharacterized protein n=1 Tax=Fonticula alba TaxID=691883 RepID=A0A058Z2W6_FONAL|nr:hypothetical protein H696_05199 [Fonticula alba]KCV68278.1 hypothetical protein H696_05199 [Fonticula alba]|eukprot:XP_009497332.1 hypothetical protein H696_05199 [Fonticula alba]
MRPRHLSNLRIPYHVKMHLVRRHALLMSSSFPPRAFSRRILDLASGDEQVAAASKKHPTPFVSDDIFPRHVRLLGQTAEGRRSRFGSRWVGMDRPPTEPSPTPSLARALPEEESMTPAERAHERSRNRSELLSLYRSIQRVGRHIAPTDPYLSSFIQAEARRQFEARVTFRPDIMRKIPPAIVAAYEASLDHQRNSLIHARAQLASLFEALSLKKVHALDNLLAMAFGRVGTLKEKFCLDVCSLPLLEDLEFSYFPEVSGLAIKSTNQEEFPLPTPCLRYIERQYASLKEGPYHALSRAYCRLMNRIPVLMSLEIPSSLPRGDLPTKLADATHAIGYGHFSSLPSSSGQADLMALSGTERPRPLGGSGYMHVGMDIASLLGESLNQRSRVPRFLTSDHQAHALAMIRQAEGPGPTHALDGRPLLLSLNEPPPSAANDVAFISDIIAYLRMTPAAVEINPAVTNIIYGYDDRKHRTEIRRLRKLYPIEHTSFFRGFEPVARFCSFSLFDAPTLPPHSAPADTQPSIRTIPGGE